MSYPINAILNASALQPKTTSDVKQIAKFIHIVCPLFFTIDLEREENTNDNNEKDLFFEYLSNYIILHEHSPTTSQKKYNTILWNDVLRSVSTKTMIGFDRLFYNVENVKTIELSLHGQCVATLIKEIQTEKKILVVSFSKPNMLERYERMNPCDYEHFENNSAYFPPLSDMTFYNVMNCLYPEAVFDTPCWNKLTSRYNDSHFGMRDNELVEEWSKPNLSKCEKFTYPTITFEKKYPVYHSWSFTKFLPFLKIHPTNPHRYTVIDFASWSKNGFTIRVILLL